MRIACLALAAAWLCVGTPSRAEPIPTLPPYVDAYQPQGVDERGIWMRADEEERQLRDSKAVIHDPQLDQYLRDVVCRTVGTDRCRNVRIYVVRDADFNAWMTPNGMMGVNSGLLLRTRDESELAAILGHEFAHFELRHSLLSYKRQRSAGDILAWAGVAAAGVATYGSYNSARSSWRSYQSIQISVYGTVFSNSREQERDADLLSMAYLRTSPYDPRCFADVWDRVMDEADATAHGRRQRSTRYDRVSFFSTHPATVERADYLRALAVSMAKQGEDGGDRYERVMATWRPQFLADQLKLNDFEGTDYLIGELASKRWTPDLLFARGELYRMRGNPRDLVSAVTFYRDAIAQDPANAEAYRGMGLAQLRSRDPAGGDTLKKYLAMKPDAPDRAMISTLVQ
jgi:Zn-dependent protease with chaperone function